MMLIGLDYHPSFQTIAFLIEESGECGEQELNHSDGQAEKSNSASSRSNQREYPVASMPTRTQIPRCFRSRFSMLLVHR